MSKALDIANNLSEFDGLAPAIDLSDVTATNVTGTNVTPTNLNIASTNHTFTVKGIDAGITDSQSGTSPDVSDSNSGQLAIYNGATKLWGINEDGWVQNPTLISFKVLMSSNQTISVNDTLVNFDTPTSWSTSYYDSTNKKFTAPINGLYCLGCTFQYLSVTNYIYPYLRVNGSVIRNFHSETTTAYEIHSANVIEYLNAGDYVDIACSRNSGSPIIIGGVVTGNHSVFYGYLIG